MSSRFRGAKASVAPTTKRLAQLAGHVFAEGHDFDHHRRREEDHDRAAWHDTRWPCSVSLRGRRASTGLPSAKADGAMIAAVSTAGPPSDSPSWVTRRRRLRRRGDAVATDAGCWMCLRRRRSRAPRPWCVRPSPPQGEFTAGSRRGLRANGRDPSTACRAGAAWLGMTGQRTLRKTRPATSAVLRLRTVQARSWLRMTQMGPKNRPRARFDAAAAARTRRQPQKTAVQPQKPDRRRIQGPIHRQKLFLGGKKLLRSDKNSISAAKTPPAPRSTPLQRQ